jgi:hypothetical protein
MTTQRKNVGQTEVLFLPIKNERQERKEERRH